MQKRMSLKIAAIAAAAVMLLAGSASALTLSKNGKTNYVIVVANDAITPEKTAAKELQKYLKQVTGAEFAIKPEASVKADAPQILVGQTQRAKKLLARMDWKSLKHDGIVEKTIGNKLILSGGQPRGAIYSVYSFLEDTVGCRWWTGTEGSIPNKPTLVIGELNVKYTPKLMYREAYYEDPLTYPMFGVKLKQNGHMYNIPKEYGGHYSLIGWCHTFYNLIPPDKYFGAHPEWFSLVNGKRQAGAAQLCLANEEMRKELVKNALELIRKDPSVGIISVTQNDCGGECQCDKCQAINKAEGSTAGSYVQFVNKVAEDIEKEFPDFYVETLAYFFTQKPPAHIKPRQNVIIRLCSIQSTFTQPLEHEWNKAFADDIRGWAAIAPNLYIWDYVTNFSNYTIPHPNLNVIAPNLRFFVKNNVVGVFEQGDCCCAIGDMVRLKAWLFGHLEWNPNLDEKKLTTEFLNGYYGAAGPYIQKYLDLLQGCAAKNGARFGCYHNETGYLKADDILQATAYFNQAQEAVKKNPVLFARVQRDRMTLDHVVLLRYNEVKAAAEAKNMTGLVPTDPRPAVKAWIANTKRWKARHYTEGSLLESYYPVLKARFGPPPPAMEQLNKMTDGPDTVVIQQDKFGLAGLGDWCKVVDDPQASDGKAAWMPGVHTQWAVQYSITKQFAAEHSGSWHWYVLARMEGAPAGVGFQYGVYNRNAGVAAANYGENLEHGGNKPYQIYYLGTFNPVEGLYFWAAPYGNGDQVKGIYIDKLVLIRNKDEW